MKRAPTKIKWCSSKIPSTPTGVNLTIASSQEGPLWALYIYMGLICNSDSYAQFRYQAGAQDHLNFTHASKPRPEPEFPARKIGFHVSSELAQAQLTPLYLVWAAQV